MTATLNEDRREYLYKTLLAVVADEKSPLVGRLLTEVAAKEDVDLEFVASAMWDLVDANELDYGSDAHVRLAKAIK